MGKQSQHAYQGTASLTRSRPGSLQGSLRNLALDVVPGEQLATASAWQGRFNHFGNILGYAMGSLNLANAPILKYVGGGQFRKGKGFEVS